MTVPTDPAEVEKLCQRYESVVRDLTDMARALGVEPSFAAMAQRVADLLNLERRVAREARQPSEL